MIYTFYYVNIFTVEQEENVTAVYYGTIFKEVCFMLLALLGTVAGVAASVTSTAVAAIPVVGGSLAAGAATIGAAAGTAALGAGASAAGATLVTGATTTACNAATLTAAGAVKEALND